MVAHGFALAKGSFRDALGLRYGWTPPHLPLQCSCGKPFDTDHALSCGTGGYSIMRHNEIRDFTASLLGEVCGDVQIEPTLIPLSGEAQLGKSANTSSEARLDVSARGFWGDRFARTMFDARIFHPNAPSVRTVPDWEAVTSLYVRHEKEKRRRYEQRVKDVEGATFVPLVFSTAGGMGRSSSATFKRITAALLAEKTGLSYAATINVVRCRCSRVRVRRVVVPKTIQSARTKCSWTATLTGKLSSFGLDPRRSSNFSFCFEHSDSVWLPVPRPWPGMPRSARLAGVTNCCWIHPTLYLKSMPSREWRDTNRIGFLYRKEACRSVFKLDHH